MKKFSVIILFVFTVILIQICACSCGNGSELPDNIPADVKVTETDVTPTDVTPTDTVPSEPFVTLVRGDKGDRVAEVQSRLIELGYLNDVADGSFGGRTKKAVVAFQRAVKLPESGEVDEATYIALMSENAPEANSEQKTTTTTATTTTKKTTTTQKKTTEKKETTTKPTTTTPKTTTTTAKPITTTKATTTTTKATRWVNKSAMDGIKSELKSYAKSLGMTWDSSLDKDTATWGSDTRAYTTNYSKSGYISAMKDIIKYYCNHYGYEYVNIIITSHKNGEYCMTCYFG